MPTASLNLRIASIFIVLASSLFGVLIPFTLHKISKESPIFICIKTCAAGVMLGIALMHLLPDANSDLIEVFPEYDLAFAITCFGIVLNLSLEQLAIILLESYSINEKSKNNNNEFTIEFDSNGLKLKNQKPLINIESYQSNKPNPTTTIEHGEHCGFVKCEHNHDNNHDIESLPNPSIVGNNDNNKMISEVGTNIEEDIESLKDTDVEKELLNTLVASQGIKDIITLYAMELSISVHSIIIGVDIGLLSGDNLATLISLIIAISFHQFVEGLGLGTNFLNSKTMLGNKKIIIFIIIFSTTTSIGIIIGILTSSLKQNNTQVAAKGIANSLACGSLLYISLTEMLANYFSSIDLINRPKLKLLMIIHFTIGISFMAILANWA